MPDTTRERISADEARQRLLEAAISLFSQRPPHEVSVREIAAEAGVNHGLVHRYYGGKPGLTRAVLRHVLRETGTAILGTVDTDVSAAIASGLDVLHRERWVVEVMAHVLLQQHSAEELPIASLWPVLGERWGHSTDVAATVATAEAATLGWLMFEPLIIRGTGLDSLDPDERRARVARVIASLLERAKDAM